jgi:hypothetical protein
MALNTTIGDASAEAYRSITDHKAYCAARGVSYGADAVLEQQARKATAYLTQAYRMRWAGSRVTATQALDWPRYEVPKRDAPGGGVWAAYYPSDSIPTEVCDAQSELMIRVAVSGDLNPDLTRGVLSEKVGQLQVDYDPNSSQATRYRAVEMLLAPLLKAPGGIPVIRG